MTGQFSPFPFFIYKIFSVVGIICKKKNKHMLSPSLWESGMSHVYTQEPGHPLLRASPGCREGVGWAAMSSGFSDGEASASRPVWDVGRIQLRALSFGGCQLGATLEAWRLWTPIR